MYSDSRIISSSAALFIAALAGFAAFAWYQAGVQADVYRRQGVEMTQWEVLIGCQPAERQIHFEKLEERKELHQ